MQKQKQKQKKLKFDHAEAEAEKNNSKITFDDKTKKTHFWSINLQVLYGQS